MKRRTIVAGALSILAMPLRAQGSRIPVREFSATDWPTISSGFSGRVTVLHLWGVTCAPCLVELPRWEAFVQRHPAVRTVFVHVDPVPSSRVEATLRRAGLRSGTQFALSGLADERLRFRMDPAWGGELPRTLLFGADGRIQERFSGSADFAELERWLSRQGAGGR